MTETRRPLYFALGLFAVFAILPAVFALVGWTGGMGLATRVLIYAVAVVALDLIIGYGAMVSFGHALFFGVGGYVVAIVAHHTSLGEMPFGGSNAALVVWPLALGVCAVLGLVVGWLALKTSGV